jgi:putative CocE/NonD family hydrolase
MWGGSYNGYAQWATAKELPPHLATIAPVAAPFYGVDLPFRNNVFFCHRVRWLSMVWGRTSQDAIFTGAESFWRMRLREFFESGLPFKRIDEFFFGAPSPILQRWLDHPRPDEYWSSRNPTRQQYERIAIPVLTITGCYDAAQPGALEHYRRHMENVSVEGRARHYLVIGPWDHPGTRTPKLEFGGIRVAAASQIDMNALHRDWYAWVLRQGPKPSFLQKAVAFYVMGAERWRYADSLQQVTSHHEPLYLASDRNPVDVYQSGSLAHEVTADRAYDSYVYDPRDVSHAALESTVDPADLCDERMLHALRGQQLVYHTAPFAEDVEISGFFELDLWLAIDRPDTDVRARIFEVDLRGASVLLSEDWIRARHRSNLSEESAIATNEPLPYRFERFTFISRLVAAGHRLRLVIGPINSIYMQKNYNGGGVVAEETVEDARPVTVRLLHDRQHASVLRVPIGQSEQRG